MVLELFEDVLPNDWVNRGKTREWLKERAEKGMFHTVVQLQDTPAFKMMGMSPDQFAEILNAIESDICKQSTKIRFVIGYHGKSHSLQDTTLSKERQNTATFSLRAELLGVMFDQKQTVSNS